MTNQLSNQHQYLRGLQFAAPIRNYNENLTDLYMEQPDEQAEALRLHLFPFIREEVLRLLDTYPTYFRRVEAVRKEAQCARTYAELPLLESVHQGAGLSKQLMPYTWEFVQNSILSYIDQLDWSLVFPNDIVRIDESYYVKPRARSNSKESGLSKACNIPSNTLGSIWTRDERALTELIEVRNFWVISEAFEPTQKGVWAFDFSPNYVDSYWFATEVALATDLVKIDIVKTMQFLKDSSSQPQPSTWGGRDNIVPSVFAHFYLSSLDCPVELSVLDMKRSEIKKLFTL